MANQSHDNHEHEDLIKEVSDQYQSILDHSDQAIYIYLDDTHKICNQKFADLLGYASPDEWAAVDEPFAEAFVSDTSSETLVGAYQKAMETFIGSTMDVTWKTKRQAEVKTTVMLVPIIHAGHILALHFIEKV